VVEQEVLFLSLEEQEALFLLEALLFSLVEDFLLELLLGLLFVVL